MARPWRMGWTKLKRESATIKKSASAEKKISLLSDDGPWRKNGGGVRSIVPSCMARPGRGLL